MDIDLDLKKRSLTHKREAAQVVLSLASELEIFTSITDWLDWLRQHNARSDTGSWVTVLLNGASVDLHVPTMTLMCDKGGGEAATVRYLLDYTQHENLERAVQEYIAKQ